MCESYVVWRLVGENPEAYFEAIGRYTMLDVIEMQALKRTAFYLDTEKPYFTKDDD